MKENNWIEAKIVSMELEIEHLHNRVEQAERRVLEHDPIVTDYGNRNIVFRLIAIVTIINLMLLVIWCL